jgi:hypothetical protein
VTPSSGGRLSKDLVFYLLSSRRRRQVLCHLKEDDGTTIVELAERIATMENDTDAESLTRQQRKRVYISLYQTHVPKLVEAGIVDHDEATGEVNLTGLARDLDVYFVADGESGYPWHVHYFGLAVLSAALFLLDVAGLPVFDALPMPIPGVLVLVAFALSALAHYVYHQSYSGQVPCEPSDTSS